MALTARGRRRIKPSNFAIPGKRKYPINTLARARNALARVAQTGTSAEKAAVRRKVRSKYPALARRSKSIRTKGPAKRSSRRRRPTARRTRRRVARRGRGARARVTRRRTTRRRR